MSAATDTLREAAEVLRDPYSRDREPVYELAERIERMAAVAEDINVATMLEIEGAYPVDPSSEEDNRRTQARRILAQVLRDMGFGS
jgi:hypothetical protein